MHVCSVRPHKFRKIKTSNGITVAYICSLIYNVAIRATHFAVSVPAQEFHFNPTPQLYMRNVNLGSMLQSKYFHICIPIHILLYQSYLMTSYHPQLNMHHTHMQACIHNYIKTSSPRPHAHILWSCHSSTYLGVEAF